MKDLEYKLVKQGSMVKNIIQDYAFVSTEGFKLRVDEYIFYQKGNTNMNRNEYC